MHPSNPAFACTGKLQCAQSGTHATGQQMPACQDNNTFGNALYAFTSLSGMPTLLAPYGM